MTEWRPQIYDMIGILFVGAIASFIIFFLLPISRELLFMELSSVARGLVLVVLAYTLGFLVQHTSRVLLPKQWKNSRIKESAWYSAFSEQERAAIITAVKEFYDLPDVPCLFSSIQTSVPITSGQAFLKYPDTVPAASGHHYRMIRPTAGTLCLKFNIDN